MDQEVVMSMSKAVAIGVASSVGTLLLMFALLATGSGAALAQPGAAVTAGVVAQAGAGGPSVTDGGEADGVAVQSPDGSRADEVDAPGEVPFTYYYVPGSTLMTRDGQTSYDYSGTGCSYTTAGTDRIMNTELTIPDGSVIKYLRIYYNDTDPANNVQGYITRYATGSQTNDLISVSSTGSGGVGTQLSAEITHTVDNFGYAYVLIGWPGVNSSAVQICGLRVAYYAPIFGRSLIPMQLHNATNP
jgi:hypothetical protein